jgi:hypothetical protein
MVDGVDGRRWVHANGYGTRHCDAWLRWRHCCLDGNSCYRDMMMVDKQAAEGYYNRCCMDYVVAEYNRRHESFRLHGWSAEVKLDRAF